ncbi:MAG: hypothetical protein ACFFD2_27385, partial [Promethearchaeota archaeon]
WIAKNILNVIRYYGDSLFFEDVIYILHFTPEKLLWNLRQVLEELGVIVIVGEIESRTLPQIEPKISWEVDLCKFSN